MRPARAARPLRCTKSLGLGGKSAHKGGEQAQPCFGWLDERGRSRGTNGVGVGGKSAANGPRRHKWLQDSLKLRTAMRGSSSELNIAPTVVDDVVEQRDVEAARRHVCHNQRAHFGGPELGNVDLARRLRASSNSRCVSVLCPSHACRCPGTRASKLSGGCAQVQRTHTPPQRPACAAAAGLLTHQLGAGADTQGYKSTPPTHLVHVAVHIGRLNALLLQQLLQELHVVPRGCRGRIRKDEKGQSAGRQAGRQAGTRTLWTALELPHGCA